MNAWKIIAVSAVAVISVALIASYAFAMGGQSSFNPNGTYGSYSSTQGPAGGTIGGGMGGMMGNGYPSNGGYQAYPQQTPYGQEYRQWSGGHGCCP